MGKSTVSLLSQTSAFLRASSTFLTLVVTLSSPSAVSFPSDWIQLQSSSLIKLLGGLLRIPTICSFHFSIHSFELMAFKTPLSEVFFLDFHPFRFLTVKIRLSVVFLPVILGLNLVVFFSPWPTFFVLSFL